MKQRRVRLGEVVQLSPKPEMGGLKSHESVAFLAMADVGDDGSVLNVQRRPIADVVKGYTAFRNGDVLLAKISPCFENGKAALVKGLFSDMGFGSTEFHVLRPSEEIDARYLFHLVWNPIFRSKGQQRMTGSAGQKRLPAAFVRDFEVDLPSITEQKRIATILDKAQSIWRKREQAFLLSNEFLRSSFLEIFGDPAKNPKGWPVVTIRDLVSSVSYGTSKKTNEGKGKYPVLRMNNLTYSGQIDMASLKYVDLDPLEEPKYLARRGDVLFNRTNSKDLVGKTAVYESDEPMAIAGYLVRVRTNDDANPHYLSGFLNSVYGKQLLKSMCKSIIGMANINAQELQSIRIMIPPRSVQDRYAEIVGRTRKLEQRLTSSLGELESINASLSCRFFG